MAQTAIDQGSDSCAAKHCHSEMLAHGAHSELHTIPDNPTVPTVPPLSCLTRAVIEESARLDAIADAILAKATAAATVAGTLHNANGCTDGGDGRGVRSAYAVADSFAQFCNNPTCVSTKLANSTGACLERNVLCPDCESVEFPCCGERASLSYVRK